MHSLLYGLVFAVVLLHGGLGYVTPDAVAFDLSPGQAAVVSGTDGQGLRVRAAPGRNQQTVTIVSEGTILRIAEGPVRDGGDDWYRVSIGLFTTGWSNGRYLAPSTTVQAMSNVAGRRTFLLRVTAYADGVAGVPLNARTASGTRTHWGVVAVDPQVIPIGSLLLIEGYEGTTFVAEDTGSGITGEAIDIWLPDTNAARTYGTQYRHVTIIREGPARSGRTQVRPSPSRATSSKATALVPQTASAQADEGIAAVGESELIAHVSGHAWVGRRSSPVAIAGLS